MIKSLALFTTSNNSFEGMRPYEHVIKLLYRHWFVIVVKLVAFFILAIAPWFLKYIYSIYTTSTQLDQLFNLFIAIYFLIWWSALFYAITMYLLDTWIITDHRVLDNEQHGLFSRTLSEMSLLKIQDISVEVKGVIPTFLNYGNLEIQTAGTEVKFIFKQIPNPAGVKTLLMEAHNNFVAQHAGGVEVHEKTNL